MAISENLTIQESTNAIDKNWTNEEQKLYKKSVEDLNKSGNKKNLIKVAHENINVENKDEILKKWAFEKQETFRARLDASLQKIKDKILKSKVVDKWNIEDQNDDRTFDSVEVAQDAIKQEGIDALKKEITATKKIDDVKRIQNTADVPGFETLKKQQIMTLVKKEFGDTKYTSHITLDDSNLTYTFDTQETPIELLTDESMTKIKSHIDDLIAKEEADKKTVEEVQASKNTLSEFASLTTVKAKLVYGISLANYKTLFAAVLKAGDPAKINLAAEYVKALIYGDNTVNGANKDKQPWLKTFKTVCANLGQTTLWDKIGKEIATAMAKAEEEKATNNEMDIDRKDFRQKFYEHMKSEINKLQSWLNTNGRVSLESDFIYKNDSGSIEWSPNDLITVIDWQVMRRNWWEYQRFDVNTWEWKAVSQADRVYASIKEFDTNSPQTKLTQKQQQKKSYFTQG